MRKIYPKPGDNHANTLEHRVCYAEVDKMAWVYYGNYLTWFEQGRTELLRQNDLTYKQMEENGFFLPVRNCQVRYYKPANYDDLVKIVTIITRLRKASITFLTIVYDSSSKMLVEGLVELACLNQNSHPAALPESYRQILHSLLVEEKS